MNDHELTHERCSELLADFAAGRLGADETARVESHVHECTDCAAELRAIAALRAVDEPLTDIERASLRRGVAAALGDVVAPARAPSRTGARLATALGAAALLAVTAVAVVSLTDMGGDEAADDSGAAVSEQGGSGGGARTRAGSGSDTGVAADQAAPPRPRPSYDSDAGKLSSRKLSKIGERGPTLRAFANYSTDDAAALKDEYVKDLAGQASTPVSSLILSCAEEVYEAQPYAALPAYAARGTLDGREALVLGFAWTDETSGRLDQFMLWTWPQSSCDQPIDYRAGRITPRS